jgi:endonuclease III-like uncharacterized protein
MEQKTEPRHKRTIAEELHQQWRNLERKGDSEAIAAVLGVSKPTIDKALIYGCVHQQKIVDGMTKYFADRIIREKESAAHLKEIQTETTQ